jgi:large conductance mechanosensitive channel protein
VLREFRAFILRGNLVDLAVAVVIGTAFTAVVNAAVRDLVTPLIAAIGGKPFSARWPSRSTTAASPTATSSTRW